MAQLHRSLATLRVIGDALLPTEITAQLGHEPTQAQTKGQELIGHFSGAKRIAKFGVWQLDASSSEPENLDSQIAELLGKLTTDINVWVQIKNKYKIDLFCGLFMNGSNEGLSISATSLQSLSERGIELGLDIYGADENQSEDT